MQNRTDFNAELLFESLKQYKYLKNKVFQSDGFVTISFHKYLNVELSDDLCIFFDTHWHPNNNEEILQFVDDLLNEKVIFYHRYKFPYWQQRYAKEDLPMLLKTKNKKFRRVFSAIKIYIDN